MSTPSIRAKVFPGAPRAAMSNLTSKGFDPGSGMSHHSSPLWSRRKAPLVETGPKSIIVAPALTPGEVAGGGPAVYVIRAIWSPWRLTLMTPPRMRELSASPSGTIRPPCLGW